MQRDSEHTRWPAGHKPSGWLLPSRRRDCHFADVPSTSLLKNLRKEEGVQQNDILADGYSCPSAVASRWPNRRGRGHHHQLPPSHGRQVSAPATSQLHTQPGWQRLSACCNAQWKYSIEKSEAVMPRSVGFVLIRAADFSRKSAQMPRPYRQALIKTIWRGAGRVDGTHQVAAWVAASGVALSTTSHSTPPSRSRNPSAGPPPAVSGATGSPRPPTGLRSTDTRLSTTMDHLCTCVQLCSCTLCGCT